MIKTCNWFHSCGLKSRRQAETWAWVASNCARVASVTFSMTQRSHAAGERQQRGTRELAPAGHVVEEGQGGGHDLLLASECGGGEFQGVEAGLGGRDEFAQAREGLEAIVVDCSVAGREGHINRERDVGDGLDGVVDRGPDVGFDASSVAQQGEVIAVDDQSRTGGRQDAAPGIGVGRAKRVVERGEGRRLHRSGGRRRGLGRSAGGGYEEDQDSQDRVSESAWLIIADRNPIETLRLGPSQSRVQREIAVRSASGSAWDFTSIRMRW